MQELKCPDCDEVMHRVREVTEKTTMVGYVQLSKHCATQHLIPSIERLLEGSAMLMDKHHFTIEDMKQRLAINCPCCGKELHEDSYFYLRGNKRTTLYCSQQCIDKTRAERGW